MKVRLLFVFLMLVVVVAGCDLSGEKHGTDDLELEDDDSGDDDDDDNNCTDRDKDGWCEPADCNDFSAAIHPGASESCFDGVDNDCDYQTDEEDSDCPSIDDDDDLIDAPLFFE